MDDLRIISDNLIQIMNERGISLDDLVKKSSISKSTLSRIRNGKANPGIEQLFLICSALDCSLMDICNSNYNVSGTTPTGVNSSDKSTLVPVYSWDDLSLFGSSKFKPIEKIPINKFNQKNTFVVKYNLDIFPHQGKAYLLIIKCEYFKKHGLYVIKKNNDFYLCEIKGSIEGYLARPLGQSSWDKMSQIELIIGLVIQIIINTEEGNDQFK